MQTSTFRLGLAFGLCALFLVLAGTASGGNGREPQALEQAALPALSGTVTTPAALPRSLSPVHEVATGSPACGRSERVEWRAAGEPRVHGRVLDALERPVAGVMVVLYRGLERFTERTDAQGAFVFTDLAAGRYQAFVETRSLPDGYLPPWRQQVPRPVAPRPSGFFGTAFDLETGRAQEVDLRVFRAALLTGLVLDGEGLPVVGAIVRMHSRRGVSLTARTDAQGAYRIDGAWPGDYETRIQLGEGTTVLPGVTSVAAGTDQVLPVQTLLRGELQPLVKRPVAAQE